MTMTSELTVLALAGLLQFAQMIAFSLAAQRALNNHFEGLILFTIAVVVLTLGQKTSTFTTILAWTYLGARILYVPAYLRGWVPGRSIIWAVGFLATILMIMASLL